MRSRLVLAAVAVPVSLSLAIPEPTGLLPGEPGVPPNYSSALPSCGLCHSPAPNANGQISLAITAQRSLANGATIPVTLSVSGGPNTGLGGFVMESDGGVLLPGNDTRTSASGDAITQTTDSSRTWDFQFQAPVTAGLVEWTAAGQGVDGTSSTGDSFGFWGPDSGTPGVPFRLFVNAPDVQPFGSGCPGTDGHEPILGASAPAAIGQVFVTELHNAPGGALAFCAAGNNITSFQGIPLPIDLGILGAPGCSILVNHIVFLRGVTTGAGSGGGSASFSWPIPNDPTLSGAKLWFQTYLFDLGGNPLGLTTTGGLEATIR